MGAAGCGPDVEGAVLVRYGTVVDVHLVLIRNGQLLWSRRANTGYADGLVALVSGHLEQDEDVLDAAIREAHEEVGIRIRRHDLQCVHVVHHRNGSDQPRLGFFFKVERWHGEPTNQEPDKCSELLWRNISDIPGDAVPYPASTIRRILQGDSVLSIHGWGDPAVPVIESRQRPR
ncbi:NUDIX domain-containing protein [Nocardia sp. CA2R105]|uniref:NUDIX hydrolase n=1 Tax=Nocardia coffeae TaxID=2873381 RepID=UPI001CA69B49|nr:NUDIX domain-containing protein [Nocardia coffeae]MBY8856894.1 NUDIX domain-containing protein [Nocardia coffeae]